MKDTIVFQSYKPGIQPEWIQRCIASVSRWTTGIDADYRFLGDELFDGIPQWIMEQCQESILPATDLGRLLWASRFLKHGYRRAIWIDSDVVIFSPDLLSLNRITDYSLCLEITASEARVYKKVNNSVSVYISGGSFLEFYINACTAIAANNNGQLSSLSFGTGFLSALHKIMPMRLISQVGILGPFLQNELKSGRLTQINAYKSAVGTPIAAANLCHSFTLLPVSDEKYIDPKISAAIVDKLLLEKNL